MNKEVPINVEYEIVELLQNKWRKNRMDRGC